MNSPSPERSVDFLKVEGDLIRSLATPGSLDRAIVTLAREDGNKIVAGSAESPEILDLVLSFGFKDFVILCLLVLVGGAIYRFLSMDLRFRSAPPPTFGQLDIVAFRILPSGHLTGGIPPP
ncbi:MAG: Diguanylate cyclase/phosphodiesterase [Leptospirillum sp. Group IV 'UBA BS']|nr:MAG: Diguanylate cyclase/phosphodiesterase [Leptospirillum sp. Group IV 'UBA BS']